MQNPADRTNNLRRNSWMSDSVGRSSTSSQRLYSPSHDAWPQKSRNVAFLYLAQFHSKSHNKDHIVLYCGVAQPIVYTRSSQQRILGESFSLFNYETITLLYLL